MDSKINDYFENAQKWQAELIQLRKIVLNCNLVEEFKWRCPCYTFQKNNIVLIHAFKEYCALLFFKGALLKDEENVLIQQTENVQAGRQIRFTSVKEIIENEAIIKSYIFEAVEVEKAGLKIEFKKTNDFTVPEEFQKRLNENPELKTAFYNLTPGRQKGYLLHFSDAKQSHTRKSRIEKAIPKIFSGKGLTDCTCGMSKRLPNCDGSHKFL